MPTKDSYERDECAIHPEGHCPSCGSKDCPSCDVCEICGGEGLWDNKPCPKCRGEELIRDSRPT